MNIELVNHEFELNTLQRFLDEQQNTFVVFSKKGVGKTSFIQHVSKADINEQYVNVKASELNENFATDFYFLRKFIESLNSRFPDKLNSIVNFLCKDKPGDISFSLNVFFAGVSYEPHLNASMFKSLIIKTIRTIDKPLYIHIENVEKIDRPSLMFFIRLIKEIKNIYFFFECISDEIKVCQYLSEQFAQHDVQVRFLEIKKLDWNQVKLVFKSLELSVDDSDRYLYQELNGDIKTLIFMHQIDNRKLYNNMDVDREFILNFISCCNVGVSIFEMQNILIKYDRSFLYKYSLSNLNKHLLALEKCNYIFNNNNYYYLTKFASTNLNKQNEELIKSILSNYYIPVIQHGESLCTDNIIKGLRILLPLYAKTQDERLSEILPYLERYLLPLEFNTSIINELYDSIKEHNHYYIEYSKLVLIRILIRLGYYQSAYDKLSEINVCSDLKNILLAITLVHLQPQEPTTVMFINNAIKQTKDKKTISALYTSLISLYMRIKTTRELKDYISKIELKAFTNVDIHIINKNLSIYSGNEKAIKSLKTVFRFFREQRNTRLLVATGITLATRYAQCGKLRSAKRIIKLLEKNCILSKEDQAYIDNNISSIDLLSGDIDEATHERLINTYYYCEDEYSKLLVANNLLIYHMCTNNMDKAREYAQFIEKVGMEQYQFDEYRHLANKNLLLYYKKINHPTHDKYKYNLIKLCNECFSEDLKKLINSQFDNEVLGTNDKWFFMSKYNFRPAFMGHWIINDFDY